MSSTTGVVAEYNAAVVAEFRDNNGQVHSFGAAPMILLHHTGARTGALRTTPLMYFAQPDGRLLIVGANMASAAHPSWFYNIQAHPMVEVETGEERFAAVAAVLPDAERGELWPVIVAAAPNFDEYQSSTTRKLPIVALSRT